MNKILQLIHYSILGILYIENIISFTISVVVLTTIIYFFIELSNFQTLQRKND